MTTINPSKGQTAAALVAARDTPVRAGGNKAEGQAPPAGPGEKVSLGTQIEFSETYGKPSRAAAPAKPDVQAILDESESKAKEIMDLILPMVQQQGLNLAKVVSGEQKLDVDQATIDKAKAAIAEDGEFGVKQVAERILNFVQGVAGDDPDKLAAMRAAVEDGFKQAAEIMGGALPEISEETRKVIMETFDRWEAGEASTA